VIQAESTDVIRRVGEREVRGVQAGAGGDREDTEGGGGRGGSDAPDGQWRWGGTESALTKLVSAILDRLIISIKRDLPLPLVIRFHTRDWRCWSSDRRQT